MPTAVNDNDPLNTADLDDGRYGYGLKEFGDFSDDDIASAYGRGWRISSRFMVDQGDNPFSHENQVLLCKMARHFAAMVCAEVTKARHAKGAG